MGNLTTHVLDTARGCPAAGMRVDLSRSSPPARDLREVVVINADGRADAPLLEGPALVQGRYRLEFAAGAYFAVARHGARRPAVPRPRAARLRRRRRRPALPRPAAGQPLVLLDLPRQLSGARTASRVDAYRARLARLAAALGPRDHRHRLDRRVVLLRRARHQPDAAGRRGRSRQGHRRRAVGGARRRLLSPAEVPGRARAPARAAALVDVGELLDLAHRLRALRRALPFQAEHLPDRQDGVRLVAGRGRRHRARLFGRVLGDLRRICRVFGRGRERRPDRRRARLRLHRLRRPGCRATCSPAAPPSCSSARCWRRR